MRNIEIVRYPADRNRFMIIGSRKKFGLYNTRPQALQEKKKLEDENKKIKPYPERR